ncbi:hypothetical protein COCNU_12G006400 [Cocos nucifera]|uniref:Peroxidase n=1 Tax=Cocos nucifera TaxID=13894 RepID=A0A8K0IRG3_COCNU|nr:hypothetical protein COCNU_12G006400 [Cocos nucifera]
MESHGSQRRRNPKRKPLFDLTNTTLSLSSSSSCAAAFPLKSYPNPKPKPKPHSSDPTPPQSSNPDETSAGSNSGFNSGGPDDHGVQIVATPSPRSRQTFLDSVDDAAQHDKSEHSVVYTRQTAERRRCREKEAGRKCQGKEAGRRCKEKAVPSTTLSCPPVQRNRSIKGKLVMDNDKVDHPKAFSVPCEKAKKVEAVCKQVVSCADILAVAARDSVVALGGPSWNVQLGRRDATTASFSDANSDIPSPTSDLSALISAFSKKGLSTTDMVALSGAHTIGQARCTVFRTRIYNETNIDASLAASLKSNCPSSGGDDNLSPLDAITPTIADNFYYKDLVNKKGLLHSDQQLYNGGSTDSQVTSYANNILKFYSDFAAAMVNMGNISPLTGTSGEIRTNCRKIN